MKTFWGAVVAVVVAVSLTGCGEVAVSTPTTPASAHRTGVAVEATYSPAPIAPEVAPIVSAAPTPVEVAEVAAVTPPDVIPAPAVVVAPAVEAAPEPVAAPAVTPAVDPLTSWLANPTFTCDAGFAPGWMNEDGVPTACVAN
ncbi:MULTISPECIES: hypothetical protein [unclassified Cryobacterium]|uniref:hypothetical protein n=1 Tax=unclassified Cryobacterium TaxID=2649013 RepID=UPI002AB40102|nr:MULTISPECIES: hypothetical protein [unclassified Cryobacterium]MDY7542592.1 hypothetical protein [Cryobacterium sp. 5B3]MEB0264712.1 hypothetical protein [Cryobacterium sp. 10I5]MEB0273684.1 hypothetical protein [Cryobacterium sp. 5B3]